MNRFTAGKKGVVFIVVLGILVLLVLLGVTFSMIARMDSNSAASYADRVRAKIIAQSGIETAIAKLKATPSQFPPDAVYWGEDANRNGKLDTGEDQNKNGILDVSDCPLDYALRPSFAAVDNNNSLKSLEFKNRKRGYSGELPSVTGVTSDAFAVKITDVNSMIYINGDGKGLERLLNNLGTILGVGDGMGTKIIDARNSLSTKRFSAKEELKSTLGDASYQKMAPYLTVYAYVDGKVIKPKPLEERPCRTVEGDKRQLNVGNNVYTWASLNSGKLELEPRAPININIAPKPILMAVLGGLEGFYLYEKNVSSSNLEFALLSVHKDTGTGNEKMSIGTIESASIELKALGQNSMAEQIADKIIEERVKSPFISWEDFDGFLDNLKKDNIFGNDLKDSQQARIDIIRANANPNTLLNDFNPNSTAWRYVDKSDLSAYTTEFCFQPMGYFEIETQSIISVPAPSSSGGPVPAVSPRKIVSDYRIKCIVNLWKNESQTTQKDFAEGTISSVSQSTSTHNGQTLQLYPEPDISDYAKKCEADGQIYLATTQNTSQDRGTNCKLQLHFDKSFKANKALGIPNIVLESLNGSPQGQQQDPLPRPAAKSIFDDTAEGPGTLYPDGALCEWGTSLSYNAGSNNFPQYTPQSNPALPYRFRGTISFWVKPDYSFESTKPRILFSATRCDIINFDPSIEGMYNTTVFELFAFPLNYPSWRTTAIINGGGAGCEGYLIKEPKGRLLWFWETDENPPSEDMARYSDEYFITHGNDVQRNRSQWMHIAMLWDSAPPTDDGIPKLTTCSNCGGQGTKPLPCPSCIKGKVTSGSDD
ncbi:MAG: hypothetical protein V1701_11890 [Planctomycetota bacterium]